jgi:phosphate starvation-inducible PhoH-like protein/PhoH-like ATPase
MGKKLQITSKNLVKVEPITDNQKIAFDEYEKGQNLFLYGAAGTGKTFISLYNSLKEVLNDRNKYERVILVRSAVPTRDIGFLPGDEEDKTVLFQIPYQNMVQYMFELPTEQAFMQLYDQLKRQDTILFLTTSYLRGITLDNSIVIVDECQNLAFGELDTIMTRVGQNSKIIFCGDFFQTDLTKEKDKDGMGTFLSILDKMESFSPIEFTVADIVRSGIVKEYLINKIKMGIDF